MAVQFGSFDMTIGTDGSLTVNTKRYPIYPYNDLAVIHAPNRTYTKTEQHLACLSDEAQKAVDAMFWEPNTPAVGEAAQAALVLLEKSPRWGKGKLVDLLAPGIKNRLEALAESGDATMQNSGEVTIKLTA
jgi:hypothetical protein